MLTRRVSPQCTLMSFVIRRLVKARSRGHIDVPYVRRWINFLMGVHNLSLFNVSFASVQERGLRGEWALPPKGSSCRAILYFHGGGYFFCSPETHRPITAGLAHFSGAQTLAVRYRLAPEHPYPAALEDGLNAYRWLRDRGFRPDQIALAGDSAGGGLALAILIALRDQGQPLPAAATVFSPWTDLACTGHSLDHNDRHCIMFSGEGIRRAVGLYVGQEDPRHPTLSPLYADLSGLPPLLLHVSDNEVLLDDSTRFARKAQQHGVTTRLKVWQGQPHVWQLFAPVMPEGRQSLAEAGEFIRRFV